jgi:hypothetical protein
MPAGEPGHAGPRVKERSGTSKIRGPSERMQLTDDIDSLEQAAGELAEHANDELLEELVRVKLKRLRGKGRRQRG